MIKYDLRENPMSKDGKSYVAMVSHYRTKNHVDIINKIIEEGSGFTHSQAIAYFDRIMRTAVAFLEEGYCINTPFFKARPTIKGVFEHANESFDATKHKVRISMSAGLELNKAAHRIGVERIKIRVPLVDQVVDPAKPLVKNELTAKSLLTIFGSALNFDKEDLSQGVFFVPLGGSESNTEWRAMVYSLIRYNEVHLQVPELPAGEYEVQVRVSGLDGLGVNTGVYSSTCTVA